MALDGIIPDLQRERERLVSQQRSAWRDLVEEEEKRERDAKLCEREIEEYLFWKLQFGETPFVDNRLLELEKGNPLHFLFQKKCFCSKMQVVKN